MNGKKRKITDTGKIKNERKERKYFGWGQNKKETNIKNESKCEGKEIHNYDRYKMKNEIN